MSRLLLTAAVVSTCLSLTVVAGAAQDALTVSPDAYRLEFENAWVKWVEGGASARIRGGGVGPSELLRFDFKTGPTESR